MMDYNLMPLSFAYANSADRLSQDNFMNLSDDEKREYIERNRSNLSDKELDELTASLGKDARENRGKDTDAGSSAGKTPESGNPYGIFRGPGIG